MYDAFVESYLHPPGVTEWLNPFDPDDINVEAEFMYLGVNVSSTLSVISSKKTYGFYYEEYERMVNSNHIITNDGWNQDTTSYNFRIRFAPNQIGNWAVKLKIETPVGNYEVLPIYFTCVPSNNPGFIHVGPPSTFLSIGENDDDFYPVGINLQWPRCDELGADTCIWIDGYDKIAPAWSFQRFGELMTSLKNSGANYFRLIITPWTYDVEFEELGNYSYRMKNAWELDQTIKKAEELDLKMQMCLTLHSNFENPSGYGMKRWDWTLNSCPAGDDAYCYSDDLGLTERVFHGCHCKKIL